MTTNHNSLLPALESTLADSYTLYLKTQNYHWNVEGAHFKELHTLFEEQYTDLAIAIDEIAENIRMLGHKTIGTFKAYQDLTVIKDGDIHANDKTMIKDLAHDQDLIINSLAKALDLAAELGDDVIADLMIRRMSIHRKNKWMLESHLK